MKPSDAGWRAIASIYGDEREASSFNALLLDHRLQTWLPAPQPGMTLLDHGAGTGTSSIALARQGWSVTAVEPTSAMAERFRHRLAASGAPPVTLLEDIDARTFQGRFDAVLSMNVLDHVRDAGALVRDLAGMTAEGGTLIICVPHPLKDLGDWHKERSSDGWRYIDYRLEGYMLEGECEKAREDQEGNVVATVVSHHRRVETYHAMVRGAGLTVLELLEPGPPEAAATELPVLYEKASRIPYFLVFRCRKEGSVGG